MTYVLDQTGAELREHMRRITDISGWDDPLATRLWAEVQALDTTVLRLEEEKTALLSGVRGLDSANRRLTETAHIAIARADGSWACGARRQGSAAGNDPVDCDWPTCGCDPYADKVIAALQENGTLPVQAYPEWPLLRFNPTTSEIERIHEGLGGSPVTRQPNTVWPSPREYRAVRQAAERALDGLRSLPNDERNELGAINWADLGVVETTYCRDEYGRELWRLVIEEASPCAGISTPVYAALKADFPDAEFEVSVEW